MSNPAWKKGMESPNPAGRAASVRKAKPAPGISGVISYAGFLASGERNAALTGSQKWTTYSNSYNVPIIATGLRYFGNLLAGTEWHAEENPAGGRKARRGVEIVEQGLLNCPLLKPWPQVVRKAAMYRALGFSLHAFSYRRRPDGMVVFGAIEHRPQHTIDKWSRSDESTPFDAVVQRSQQSGKEYKISLSDCFYCVDDTLTDSPDGIGLLRHVIEYVRRLGVLEKMEGSALVRDMGGMPVGSAPIAEIAAQLGTDDQSEIQSAIDAATLNLRNIMEKRNKTPEEAMFWLKDSSTYRNPDGTPTAVAKWALEIVRSETANLGPTAGVIHRIELQIARVLGIEFALMGADGKGSYAQHADKTSMFAANLQTTLTELGWFATMQLARRLVARNGLDPDTCTPRLVAAPVRTADVLVATQALANLSMAGLRPDDPAINEVRGWLRIPEQPESALDDLALPRRAPPTGDVTETDDPTGAEQQRTEETAA